MKRIEFELTPTVRTVALEEHADYIVDSYPMQQWLWDHANSDEEHGHWIFYANEAAAVKAFFDGIGRERGFTIANWRVSDVAVPEEQAIRARLS